MSDERYYRYDVLLRVQGPLETLDGQMLRSMVLNKLVEIPGISYVDVKIRGLVEP